MIDMRKQFTKADRQQTQDDISSLRVLLLPLLKRRDGDCCNRCRKPAKEYDVHHKVYNPKLTLNELELLCIPCHVEVTDYRRMKDRY